MPVATKPKDWDRDPIVSQLKTFFLEQKVQNYRELIDAFSKLPPTENTHLTFAIIGGVPVKMATKVRCALLGTASVGVLIEAASEADVVEALRLTNDYETRVRLRTFLNRIHQKETEREPLEVKIVNPAAIGGDKVLRIKRDDTGKMTGATVMNAGG